MLLAMVAPIHFMVGFLILICVLAIIIIAARWLLALSGIAIPQPLLTILGIILFIVLLLMLVNWAGYWPLR